jgi:hypothetical protein
MRIQAAQSFERQGRRPSALGHDGLWRWIFANRILADRILANRSRCRRRRLPARQIGSGGSAQHRKGCSRCGQNLQHDVAPLKVCNNLVRADSARSNGKMPEQRQSHNEKGDLLIRFPDICCIKSTSLKGSERRSRRHDATRRQLFASAARERSRRTKEVRPPQRAEMQASTTDVLGWPS